MLDSIFNEMAEKARMKNEEVQKKRAEFMPKFDNEEEALAYAKRIALLEPGAKVSVLNKDDTGLHSAILVSRNKDGNLVFLAYNPDNKRLYGQVTSWFAIVLD